MDQTADRITDQERSATYDAIFDTVYSSLEKGEISEADARASATFIIDHLETVSTPSELLSFLEDLSKQYPIYYNVYLSKKDQLQTGQKIDQVQDQINTMERKTEL